MTPQPEPLINSTWVFIIHLVIVVTNVLGVIFSTSWVYYICLRMKNIRKQARNDMIESTDRYNLQNKLRMYYPFLAVMIIEAIHVALRLGIYIVFTILDKYPHEPDCGIIGEYKAYHFIENLQPYQFIWIGLSHSFALALMVSMTITMLYLRETYNYYKTNLKWVKIWIVIGIVQFLSVWIFLSIPYIALIGSLLFTVYAFVDFAMLFRAAKRLLAILNMRLFDLQYESTEYTMFRRSMDKIQWLWLFLVSLFVYLVGIVLAHVAIWMSLSPCYLDTYFNVKFPVLNATQVETVANVASIVWLLDYVAIFQFDVVLMLANLFDLIYTRLTRSNIREETRHLMEQHNDCTSHGPRTYSTL